MSTTAFVPTLRALTGAAFFALALTAPPVQAQTASGMELDSLIRLILIPSGESYNVGDWRAGSDANTPINWLHAGIEDAGDGRRTDYGAIFPFVRRGEAVVTVNRKPTHQVLGRRVEPGKWDITLLGARAGTVALQLAPQSSAHDMPDLLAYLKKKGVALKHLKCFQESPMSGVQVYRMAVKGFKPTYLQYSWSNGSGGGSQYLTISSDDRILNSLCANE